MKFNPALSKFEPDLPVRMHAEDRSDFRNLRLLWIAILLALCIVALILTLT